MSVIIGAMFIVARLHSRSVGLMFSSLMTITKIEGCGGLMVGPLTAVRENPGLNLTAAGRVYHDSHCNIQPWAQVVHPYCSA